MLVILSPAKNMRRAGRDDVTLRKPMFRQQTEELAAVLRQYRIHGQRRGDTEVYSVLSGRTAANSPLYRHKRRKAVLYPGN